MSNWALTEHITRHMTRPRLGDPRPPSLWPSDGSAQLTNEHGETYVVGACRRATFFRYITSQYDQGEKRWEELANTLRSDEVQPDKYTRWIWVAGNLFEDFVVEQAKESGVYIASQVQLVIPQYNIVGKLDLLVMNPETGGLIAEEVKSIYGYNANEILGKPGIRMKGQMGKPRDSNLIQAAVYNWHLKQRLSNLESTRLLYGARDTGRFAEYEVKTYERDGQTRISYRGVSPVIASEVESPITIDAVLAGYKYVHAHYTDGVIPPRDYNLQFSDEQIHNMYERGELSKTDKEAYEKILARKRENEERLSEGEPLKKELKPIEKGNYQCGFCQWQKYCYNDKNEPVR